MEDQYFERRKCAYTCRNISATDRSSVKIHFAELDETGRSTGKNVMINLCGEARKSEGLVDNFILNWSREELNK